MTTIKNPKTGTPEILDKLRSWYKAIVVTTPGEDQEATTRPVSVREKASLDLPLKLGMVIPGGYDFYTVSDEIYSTPLSRVYLGGSKIQGKPVAIKEYREDTPSLFFERERYAQKVFSATDGHENILPAYEFLYFEGRQLGVFPYVIGGTLEDIIRREQKLTPQQAAPFVVSLCDALEYVHTHGIVHRDVKPSNVLVPAETKKSFLFDFGVCWHSNLAHLDTQGHTVGTPYYMAPEAILAKTPAKEIDMYALGILVYRMLAGRTPFIERKNINKLFLQHFQEPIPDLTQFNPLVTKDLQFMVGKALAKDPEERYHHAGEFKQAWLAVVG